MLGLKTLKTFIIRSKTYVKFEENGEWKELDDEHEYGSSEEHRVIHYSFEEARELLSQKGDLITYVSHTYGLKHEFELVKEEAIVPQVCK
jgi:hypothetical protein